MENHASLKLHVGELGLKPGGTGINILTGAGWWNDRTEQKLMVNNERNNQECIHVFQDLQSYGFLPSCCFKNNFHLD